MNRMARFALIFLASLFSAAVCNADLDLARNGKSLAVLVLAPDVDSGIQDAATDLQNYFEKITGAPLELSLTLGGSTPAQGKILIMVTTVDQAGKLLTPEMKKKLSGARYDACSLSGSGKRILIVGNSVLGARNGIYVFLQKYLGCRWFYPGEMGEYYPKNPTISLKPFDYFHNPSYKRRELGCFSVFKGTWDYKEIENWTYRNCLHGALSMKNYRFGSEGKGGHMSFQDAVPESLFDEHPEYFPLIDGKRVKCLKDNPEMHVQRCVSNPKVREMMIKSICDFYDSTEDGSYCMGAWDIENAWCQCDACRKMADDHGDYSISKIFHVFYSDVAREVRKKYPNAKLNFFIYSQYRDPPKPEWKIEYPENIEAIYCPHGKCEMHRFNDPNCFRNKKYMDWYVAWKKAFPKMEFSIFDYLVCVNNHYAPLEYIAGENVKQWVKDGFSGYIDHQNNENQIWTHNWQLTYMNARLLWDASLSVEEIMDEAYDLYYGPAAKAMKKYHAYRRQLWENAPTVHCGYPHSPDRTGECLLVPGSQEKLEKYLAKALEELDEASKDPKADKERIEMNRARVRQDQKFLETIWVENYKKIEAIAKSDRKMPVRPCVGKITIDGSLDEDAWKKALPVDSFRQSGGGDPTEQTRVSVLYDSENWYIGIEALTENAKSPLTAKIKGLDNPKTNTDDSLELFIAAPGQEYRHWMINTNGAIYDAKGTNKVFKTKIQAKVKVHKKRYVLEAKIPVQSLGASKIEPGQVWQFHFWRNVTNLQAPASHEMYGLDGVKPHDQPQFRRAMIGTPVLNNGDFSIIDKEKHFPKDWSITPGGTQTEAKGRTAVNLHPSALYQYMKLDGAWKNEKYVVTGRLLASGISGKQPAQLTVYIRTNRDQLALPEKERKSGVFGERRDVLKTNLTENPQEFTFEFDMIPGEHGYLYVTSATDATVYYVMAARKE